MSQKIEDAIEQIKSGDQVQLWEAVKLLIAGESPAAVPALIDLMNGSSDVERRVAAASALGSLRSLDALQSMIRILDDKSVPPKLRDQVAESLGYISDPRARSSLLRNVLDENADVVFSCVFALRTIGELKDIPLLERLASDSSATNSYGCSIAKECSEAIEQIRERAKAV